MASHLSKTSNLSRLQVVLAVALLIGAAFAAAFFAVDATRLIDEIAQPLTADEFKILGESADLSRETFKAQVLVNQLRLESTATTAELPNLSDLEQQYAFVRLNFRTLTANGNYGNKGFQPGSLDAIADIEESLVALEVLFESLNETSTAVEREPILAEMDTHFSNIAQSANRVYLIQEQYRVGILRRLIDTAMRSRILLGLAGAGLLGLSGLLYFVSRRALTTEQAANARFQLAAEAVESTIFDWDMSRNTLIWSGGDSDAFGYGIATVQDVEAWWLAHAHPQDRAYLREKLTLVQNNGRYFSAEYRFLTAVGEYRDVAHRGQLIRQRNGQPSRMVGSLADITHQREVIALQESNRALNLLLANVSHELRTPLGAIIGYGEMLQELAEDTHEDEVGEIAGRITYSGQHLLQLVNNMLNLTKAEAGQMEIYTENFAVEKVAQLLATTMRPLVAQRDNELVIALTADLGTMHSDLTKIQQILLNLLSNANKFTHEGTITLAAERELAASGEWIVFRVRDTGIGMTSEQQARIFAPFTQAEASTERHYGGTGLGLTISRRFAELLGGEIRVSSESGVGTTFTVRLPAQTTTAVVT